MKFDERNAWHFIGMTVVVNAVVFGLMHLLLVDSHYGDGMPYWFKIAFPAFLFVVATWFFIAHRPCSEIPATPNEHEETE